LVSKLQSLPCATPRQQARLKGRDASRIVASVLKSPQRLKHCIRDRFAANNTNDSAHSRDSRAMSPINRRDVKPSGM
jgi:hypothetical protein